MFHSVPPFHVVLSPGFWDEATVYHATTSEPRGSPSQWQYGVDSYLLSQNLQARSIRTSISTFLAIYPVDFVYPMNK
jgi:hypothetical protein